MQKKKKNPENNVHNLMITIKINTNQARMSKMYK